MVKSFVGIGLLAIALTGCISTENYRVGDLTKNYCESTDPVFRAQLRELMQVPLGVDVCLTYGLVDALVKTEKPDKDLAVIE